MNSLLVVVLLAAAPAPSPKPTAEQEKEAKAINAEVAALEKRIKAREVAHLDVKYDLEASSDFVPPSFRFYFETKGDKPVLLGCVAHVGHGTWARVFTYWFRPGSDLLLKYLEQGGPTPEYAGPYAMLYDAKGTVVWKNMDGVPRTPPKVIRELFETLQTRLDAFAQ